MPLESLLRRPDVRCREPEKTAEKFGALRRGDLSVITDFDFTVTTRAGCSSFSVCSGSGLMPAEYVAAEKELFGRYCPIERDPALGREEKTARLRPWWNGHLGLLKEHRVRRGMFDEKSCELLVARTGVPEFLRAVLERGAAVAALSAGLEDTIRPFMRRHGLEGAYLRANRLTYGADGVCDGHEPDLVQSTDKDLRMLPENVAIFVRNRANVVLMGDVADDVTMLPEGDRGRALKIGFARDAAEADALARHFDLAVASRDGDGGALERVLGAIR